MTAIPSLAAERSSEEKYAMMISTKGRYALRVMIDLAESGLEEQLYLLQKDEHGVLTI